MSAEIESHHSDKSAIRNVVLDRRDAMPVWQRAVVSSIVRTRLLSLILPREGVISGFLPIRSEIDLAPVLVDFVKAGRTVVLPVVVDKTRLEFRRYDPDQPLADAGFGTIGPGPEAEVIDPDIVIVPFSAFDRTGARIGYGAGHYDRALSRLGSVFAVGAGYAMQEVDCVPSKDHDWPLDTIVTDHETLTIGARL